MKNILTLLVLLSIGSTLFGQSAPKNMVMTLDEVIRMARGESPDIQIASAQLNRSYWQLEAFNAGFKPQIDLELKIPSLNSAIIEDPTTLEFLSVSSANSSFSFEASQEIAKTGGRIFASSGLRRSDRFEKSGNSVSYLSTPINVGINQPLFAHNTAKWTRQIEPLKYEEAERQFTEEKEDAALQATTLFFNVYIAQISMQAARANKANADTLFRLAEGRFSVGKIAENELLQMDLSAKRAQSSIARAQLDLQTSTENLRNFLGIKEYVSFDLTPPASLPDFVIDVDKALAEAIKNRKEPLGFDRRMLEANKEVARAKEEGGVNANLFASFGLSSTGADLGETYSKALRAQQLEFGVTIPIMDWGRAKAAREIAASNLEITQLQIEQERINFEQNILLKINQFGLLRDQAELAKVSYDITLKRYDISKKRYLIGRIAVTDLNIAQAEQDSSLEAYMQSLRAFWTAYYELRKLTLYDFEKNAVIGD